MQSATGRTQPCWQGSMPNYPFPLRGPLFNVPRPATLDIGLSSTADSFRRENIVLAT